MADSGLHTFSPRDPEQMEAFIRLHEITLPDSVPVQFGRRFMRDFYFRSLVEDGLIAGDLYQHEGRFVGYNLYTPFPHTFLREGIRRHFFALCALMPRVFASNPQPLLAIPHMLRNTGGMPEDRETGYWLTFGVDPVARVVRVEGKPVARWLVERMFDYFREAGMRAVEGTVEAKNRAAILFYKSCGFTFEDRGFENGAKLQVRYEV